MDKWLCIGWAAWAVFVVGTAIWATPAWLN